MSQEILYTSAPRGVRPGSKGFCTVAMTEGMSNALVERLESLSGYRPLYPAGHPRQDENPVLWAHWRVAVGGKTHNVLSRVCFAGMDYTQRSNKFAHHLVPDVGEQPAGGPAWLMSQPGVMESAWSDEPTLFEGGRGIPDGDEEPRACEAWTAAAGDAGWAGVLAQSFLEHPGKPAYVIYEPGTDALALVAEALALIAPEQRWEVTFNTYFTDLPASVHCLWRFCVAASAAAKDAKRSAAAGSLLIDLTSPLGIAPASALADAARTGQLPQAAEEEPMPVAPPLAAMSPVASAAIVVEPEEVPDPSWIPPVEATVVETTHRRPPAHRPGGGTAAWVVAAVGWLAAIALGVLWLWPTPLKPHGNPDAQAGSLGRELKDAIAAREQAETERDARMKELAEARKQLEARKREVERRAEWIPPDRLQVLVKKAFEDGKQAVDLSKYISRVEHERQMAMLRRVNRTAQPVTQGVVKPAVEMTPTPRPRVAELPDGNNLESVELVKIGPGTVKKLSLELPGPANAFSIDDRTPGRLVLQRPLKSGLGKKSVAEIGSGPDGAVMFAWKVTPPDVEARQLLEYSRIVLQRADGTEEAIQLIKPKEHQAKWDWEEVDIAFMLPKPSPAELKLKARPVSTDWTSGEDVDHGTTIAHRSRPEDTLIAVTYANGTLRQDRKMRSFNAHRRLLQCEEDIEKLNEDMARFEEDGKAARALVKRMGDAEGPAAKEARSRAQQAKIAEDGAKKALAAAQQAKAAAEKQAASYKAPAEVDVDLHLPNGVWLGTVRFAE